MPKNVINIEQLFRQVHEKRASDLILTEGVPPQARICGTLESLDFEALTPQKIKELAYSILSGNQIESFERLLYVCQQEYPKHSQLERITAVYLSKLLHSQKITAPYGHLYPYRRLLRSSFGMEARQLSHLH